MRSGRSTRPTALERSCLGWSTPSRCHLHPHVQCIVIIEQAGLNLIKKELNLLQRLYKLYNDVINSVNGYFTILWKEVDVEYINNELMDFSNR